jgi:uncharacterized OsmC-like protein
VACSLDTGRALAEAGLHPAAGGERNFRGTLAVSKDAPVGFREIRIDVDLDTDASDRELAALTKLTERYCVVWRSLRQPPEGSVSISRVG